MPNAKVIAYLLKKILYLTVSKIENMISHFFELKYIKYRKSNKQVSNIRL